MENNTQEEIVHSLLKTDNHFRDLVEQHGHFSQLIDQIEAKPHVTPEDEIEEQRLKKLKLHVKDELTEIVTRRGHA